MPTIRALREQFAQVADAEVQKALEQLARKELTREQQRELLQRLVQLVVNKLLHQPTTVLRGADPDRGAAAAPPRCASCSRSSPSEVDRRGCRSRRRRAIFRAKKAQA